GQFAPRPDPVYWSVLVVALCGPMSWVAVQSGDAWATNFSAALWISIASSLVLFALLVAVTAQAWRLTPLLLPYLVVLGLMATIWQQAPGRPLTGTAPAIWLDLHILVSVLTYALLTLAAMAGLAVFLQERALKLKRPDRLSSLLPPIADSELLQVRLLIAGEIVLGVGLATGMALQYFGRGRLLIMDHKTLLSVVAFVLIAGLLAAHYRTGLRGRRAARLALCAYLLLTLAYPGVKFVTDVLVGR
ncbi:MAG: hypothetical protein FJX52_04190, partial [Alphaproteobacteria bacterium]|nr:hypothetical protein [Alphaproteobacteria bacterium]